MNRRLILLLFIGLTMEQYKTPTLVGFEGKGISQSETSIPTDQT
tara:strand:+ start:545 stop:676 length:132 start_codon:yes stop_codon:yes gene_type:complete